MGVWQFTYEHRDIRDKTKHPATYPIALARAVFTKIELCDSIHIG